MTKVFRRGKRKQICFCTSFAFLVLSHTQKSIWKKLGSKRTKGETKENLFLHYRLLAKPQETLLVMTTFSHLCICNFHQLTQSTPQILLKVQHPELQGSNPGKLLLEKELQIIPYLQTKDIRTDAPKEANRKGVFIEEQTVHPKDELAKKSSQGNTTKKDPFP